MKKFIFKLIKNKKFLIGAIVVSVLLIGWRMYLAGKANKVTYETTIAEKGTLISSISGSGTITSGNNTSLDTKVSGVVAQVFVTNGDMVKKGQKIAYVTLDEYARERETAAWMNYLDATETVKQSVNDKAVSDIDMWKARQEVLDAQTALDDMNDNNTNPATHAGYTDGERMIIIKTLDQKRKAFLVIESKYLDANANIAYSNAKVAAALRDYQENSATIVAPESGEISDLALATGLTLNADTQTSNTSGATIVSSQTVGKISNPKGQLLATVNLSEVDILKVKANQKVTLTLDAYTDKSFTGKVLSINTTGSVSQNVTNYPVTILLDQISVPIYTNMAVSVQIIINIKPDVVMIPTTAITTNNGASTVQIKKNNQISTVEVMVGDSNDSQSEIISGLSAGDVVVTATIYNTATGSAGSSTSPFSGLGRTGTSNSSNNRNTRVFIGGPGGF